VNVAIGVKYLQGGHGGAAELLGREEALLEYGEEEGGAFLGLWEAREYFVVLGYGKQLAAEVYEEECARLKIPILRRASGGGTVLQGPGCLNYTLVLPIDAAEELGSISGTNVYIMQRIHAAIASVVNEEVRVQGYTDLTWNGLKFSGNAQRRKRRSLLFHGSFLLNFDLELVSRTLRLPGQQPEYRAQRLHSEFITNLNVERSQIEGALLQAWGVTQDAAEDVAEEVRTRAKDLVEKKYSQDEWNRRF
jgi:lipoate-protein ligase A